MAAPFPSPEIQAKVASEAAQNFVDYYYDALNRRNGLAPFYASTSNKLTAAAVKPDISINGNVCETVADFEHLLNTQDDVGSFDAQPVNPNFVLGAPPSSSGTTDRKAIESGDRISIAIQVNGTVRYGKAGDEATTERAFNEAWLLVPHWEAWARNAPRGLRRWVVVSQNFRAL